MVWNTADERFVKATRGAAAVGFIHVSLEYTCTQGGSQPGSPHAPSNASSAVLGAEGVAQEWVERC